MTLKINFVPEAAVCRSQVPHALARLEPDEDEATAVQHPGDLGEDRFELSARGVDDRVPQHDAREGVVGVGQIRKGANAELQVAAFATCHVDHRWGEIKPLDAAPTIGQVPGHTARPATGVQDSCTSDKRGFVSKAVDHREVYAGLGVRVRKRGSVVLSTVSYACRTLASSTCSLGLATGRFCTRWARNYVVPARSSTDASPAGGSSRAPWARCLRLSSLTGSSPPT